MTTGNDLPPIVINDGPDLETLLTALTLRLRGGKHQIKPDFEFMISSGGHVRTTRSKAEVLMVGEGNRPAGTVQLRFYLDDRLRFGLCEGFYNPYHRTGEAREI